MKAVVLQGTGGSDQLVYTDVPTPEAGPGQVRVALEAAALNHRDVWIRRGLYAGISLPVILGSDGVGRVDTVGDGVDEKLIGKRVWINPSLSWGSDLTVLTSKNGGFSACPIREPMLRQLSLMPNRLSHARPNGRRPRRRHCHWRGSQPIGPSSRGGSSSRAGRSSSQALAVVSHTWHCRW
ncbi:MAG: alcohol dehydrogenase catalytic domain-containing protein [bacterium]